MSSTSVTFELRGDLMKPGFKPLIWELAVDAGLGGWVTDSPDGSCILLRLDGDEEDIRRFIRPIPGKLLPAYPLKSIRVAAQSEFDAPLIRDFKVFASGKQMMYDIQPDRKLCPDCLAVMMDPDSKRHVYPFSFCIRCGPGFSMLTRFPLDRRNTTYAAFPACMDCKEEQADSADHHHFKSGMLSCPACGPHLFLLDEDGEQADDENCICNARNDLRRGKVLAVQSLYGGFQLFVDAVDPEAIVKLRKRKKLTSRPVSVVARDIETVKKIFHCSPQEEDLLLSEAAPVVILDIKPGADQVLPVDLLNPDGPRIGVALPSSSLLHLLMQHAPADEEVPPPFEYLATITSNWNEKSSATGIDEQLYALRGVADVFWCHDLPCGSCCPASVAVIRDGAPQIWRRSRGYVPTPVRLTKKLRRNVIAFGTDINAAVALASEDRMIPSQLLGDVLNMNAAARLTDTLRHFMMLFDCVPDVVACDMNPRLLSAEEALRFANKYSLPLVTVQTHHAKALAGMAEHGLERALAFVFDNGEPGPDGVYWGAELLDVDIRSFRRIGTFQPVGLPGRENALSRPVRQLIGRLIQAGVEITPAMLDHFHVSEEEVAIWQKNCAGQGRFLTTHAAARLFDSVSAGLGIAPDFTGYRGQSAARLEYAAMQAVGGLASVSGWMYDKFAFDCYEDDTPKMVVDWAPLFRNFADLSWIRQEDIPRLALAFHAKIADSIACLAHYGATKTDTRDILLSGAIFMNGILLDLVLGKLRKEKYNVYIHRSVPMDGSGICVGQALNAAF
ncbi:MAG: carbamoyltransferase HypF [Lentisphaeria bacterium]|nr:carbamoyltransferase HypF [Lentisphaeria bacterium]